MHKVNEAKIAMYVSQAENRTTPPSPPKSGIPKQWVPSYIRWPLRVLAMPFIWLDIAAQKIARKIIPTPYRSEGHCLKRGNCCYYIIMAEPKKLLTRLVYFWHTQINGFYYRDTVEVDEDTVCVMGCRYLQKNGSCGHHILRPQICREWPRIEYFDRPKILKGCGYRAVPRNPPPGNPPPVNGVRPDKMTL